MQKHLTYKNTYDKYILIYEHYGNIKSRLFPKCELIFNDTSTKQFIFTYNDIQNIIDLQNSIYYIYTIPTIFDYLPFNNIITSQFIDNYGKDGPFAMMVGFPGPHDPYDPSEDFGDIPAEDSVPEPIPIYEHDESHVDGQKDGGRAEWADLNFNEMNGQDSKKKRKMRSHYAGLVQQIDSEVGEIIKSLEKNNLIDNTVIFFATDHGDHLGDHGLFKFGEMTFHEATAHIP